MEPCPPFPGGVGDGIESKVCCGSINEPPGPAVPGASPLGRAALTVTWETGVGSLALVLWPCNGGSGAEAVNHHPLEDVRVQDVCVRKFLDERA